MEVIPERADICWVALDPKLGSEIRKLALALRKAKAGLDNWLPDKDSNLDFGYS